MIPAKKIHLSRTEGDTEDLVISLTRRVGISGQTTVENAADSDTVSMVVDYDGSNILIAGISNGEGDGVFRFPIATLPEGPWVLNYEVSVAGLSGTATWVIESNITTGKSLRAS